MKTAISAALSLLVAASAWAADTNSADQVKAAITKLKAETNYSWTVKTELPSMGFTPDPMEGKTEKDGFTLVTQNFNDNMLQAAFKGEKAAMNVEGSWVLAGTNTDESQMGWWLAYTKPAAVEAGDLLAKAKSLKAGDGGLLSSDLSEEGAKELLTFGRRSGGNGPPPAKNAKASVKFWLKEGALSKYESHVSGTVAFGPDQEEREMDMIRTVEVHDNGKTKVEVPADARKLLEAK